MSFLQALIAAVTSKAAAGAAAATVAVGGVAAATNANVPDDKPEPGALDRIEASEDEDDDAEGEIERIDISADEESTDAEGDEDVDDEGDEDGDDERSEVAKAVHEALTDGEAVPGDEDFGQIVSENAREGGLGQKVSEAARGAAKGDDPEDDDPEGEGSEDEGSEDDDPEKIETEEFNEQPTGKSGLDEAPGNSGDAPGRTKGNGNAGR